MPNAYRPALLSCSAALIAVTTAAGRLQRTAPRRNRDGARCRLQQPPHRLPGRSRRLPIDPQPFERSDVEAVKRTIRDTVVEQLSLKGFREVQGAPPDFLVSFHLVVTTVMTEPELCVRRHVIFEYPGRTPPLEEVEVCERRSDGHGARTLRQGTLVVFVVDPSTLNLLWQGAVVGAACLAARQRRVAARRRGADAGGVSVGPGVNVTIAARAAAGTLLLTLIAPLAAGAPGCDSRPESADSRLVPPVPGVDPWPRWAGFQQRFVLTLSNTTNIETASGELLYVDGESLELRWLLAWQPLEHVRVRLTVPVVHYSGGVLDEVVDQWHDFLNLPGGPRPGVSGAQPGVRLPGSRRHGSRNGSAARRSVTARSRPDSSCGRRRART